MSPVKAKSPRLVLVAALVLPFAFPPSPPPVQAGSAKVSADAVGRRGLDYLINQQHKDGGWGQGGGWRQTRGGGRSQGDVAAERSDVGNTSTAILALLRAGSTPTAGPYAENLRRGVRFVCGSVRQSDAKSMYVTDIHNTQLQMKIGQFADTFLASLAMAEVKGHMPDSRSETMLGACLDKIIKKIEHNQRDDGSFAGNHGWASVLSQGLATSGLNAAKRSGAAVSGKALARAQKQAESSFDKKTGSFAKPLAGSSDAGVTIYGSSAGLSGLSQSVATGRKLAGRARAVLDDRKASKSDKDEARDTLGRLAEAEVAERAATGAIVKQLGNDKYIAGFGSNGGEEFLSYLNISEALAAQGGKDWQAWKKKMAGNLSRVQNKDGSWAGHHCITGRTFVTAMAMMVLLADQANEPLAGDIKSR